MFVLNGYEAHFMSRANQRGGGIALFVRTRYCTTSMNFSFINAECLPIKITLSNTDLILLAIYRPPKNSVTRFLCELDEVLNGQATVDQICVVGDLNINILNSTTVTVSDYLSILSKYGLQSTINFPTREECIQTRLVSSCIDHIAMRAPNYSLRSCVIRQKLADHYFVACRLCGRLPMPSDENTEAINKSNELKIEIFNSKVFDQFIAQFDWMQLTVGSNYSIVYENFCEQLLKFERSSTYVITKKYRKNYSWFTADIMRAISYRDWLWKRSRRSPKNQDLKIEYKIARNRVVALLRSAKKRYFLERFNQAYKNSAKTWALINNLRGKKITPTDLLESFSEKPEIVVDKFNSFFTRFSKNAHAHKRTCTLKQSVPASAYLPMLSKEDLRRIIFSFRPNKQPGIDGVAVSTLRRNFEALAEILLFILNGFLTSASIPEKLKTAIVKPLFKAGKKDDIENYRPISILPILSQILEKFLLQCMTSFLQKFSLLTPRQFGFIANRSTTTLLEEFSDEIYSALDKNLFCCALFLDLAKAFETVNHGILLEKLFRLGFRGPFYDVLHNYLQDRSQVVKGCREVISNRKYITAGVPQGSVLSPLLFNLFMNDFPSGICKANVYQYADDTVLLTRHIRYEGAINALQSAIHEAMLWFEENCLIVNEKKTKLICFRSPLKIQKMDMPIFLHTEHCKSCKCTAVEIVETFRYLGVIFHSGMSWQHHMAFICSKLRSVACLLFNIKSLVPLPVKKMIVHSLAYSTVRYGITVFAFCSERWKTRIDSLLRNILKSVAYGSKVDDNTLFYDLGFSMFHDLFTKTVILRYNWCDDFKVPYVARRPLREKKRFTVPRFSTRYGEACRSVYIPKIFNELPEEFFSASSKKQLKKLLSEL
uniref:Putative tick transposon n=1 Tax=Rhipicephalus pulchellus TaxID=72859 RepID=L7LW06_RHIPC